MILLLADGNAQSQTDDPAAKYQLDTNRFMFSQVESDSRIRSEDRNPDEYRAYNSILMHAHQFPTQELLANARQDVSLRDLLSVHRGDYQFQLIRLDGRLLRLKQFESPRELKFAGIDVLYEAWLVPKKGTEPIAVVLTEKPDGLIPENVYQPAKLVSVAGYYFKALRYDAQELTEGDTGTHVVRRAPLLLGHSLEIQPEPKAIDSSVDLSVVLAIIAGILFIVLAYIGWVARGDRLIKRELQTRLDENPFNDSQT